MIYAGCGLVAEMLMRGTDRRSGELFIRLDPDALLYRKGPGMEARLCFIGHGLMESCSDLIVDARLTRVSGHAERLAALDLIAPHGDRPRAVTHGADNGYDGKDFDNMYMTSFVQYLVDSGWDVRAIPVDGGWLEIDSVDDLETYEKWAQDGALGDHITI